MHIASVYRPIITHRKGELSIHDETIPSILLAERFNTHFSNIPSSAYNGNALSYVKYASHAFFLNPTDEIEVVKVFLGLIIVEDLTLTSYR